ncbi:unnamed protein product [Prunus armeniaca]
MGPTGQADLDGGPSEPDWDQLVKSCLWEIKVSSDNSVAFEKLYARMTLPHEYRGCSDHVVDHLSLNSSKMCHTCGDILCHPAYVICTGLAKSPSHLFSKGGAEAR